MLTSVGANRLQVWDGNQAMAGQFDSLTACMEAARERQLPPSYERDLVMLHTMKPHFDAARQGEQLRRLRSESKVHGKRVVAQLPVLMPVALHVPRAPHHMLQ